MLLIVLIISKQIQFPKCCVFKNIRPWMVSKILVMSNTNSSCDVSRDGRISFYWHYQTYNFQSTSSQYFWARNPTHIMERVSK